MKPLAAVILAMALTGCAEITKFEKADGTVYYYVDCENKMRLLETCSFAARRTCPNGYSPIKVSTATIVNQDRKYIRCTEENREHEEKGEPKVNCVKTPHNEGFFVCN